MNEKEYRLSQIRCASNEIEDLQIITRQIDGKVTKGFVLIFLLLMIMSIAILLK